MRRLFCRRCQRRHETLEARYEDDEVLLGFMRRNLPRRNWAGLRDCTEKHFTRQAKRR